MAKLFSKTTYERTVSEGVNFSDLDSKELITKEVLIQVLGIKDPGELFTPITHTFTIVGTATAADSFSIANSTAANPTTFNFANGDTAAQVATKIIGDLARTKPGIYNFNLNGSILTVSHVFTTPADVDQFITTAASTTSGITLSVTTLAGIAGPTAYYVDANDRKDIS